MRSVFESPEELLVLVHAFARKRQQTQLECDETVLQVEGNQEPCDLDITLREGLEDQESGDFLLKYVSKRIELVEGFVVLALRLE
jgi:hypothetical protein